jgi:ATP-dependent RNA helicase DHX57
MCCTNVEHTPFQLIGAVVKHIVDTAPKRGGILIFLPGVQEITQCMEAVRSVVGGADVFPLHANLSSDEQRRVFVSSKNWKIIAATNVAEARHPV